MGSANSGNRGNRPTVEDGLTLNLPKLLRDGFFQPRTSLKGTITWTNTMTGGRVGWIGYEACLGEAAGRVRLQYTTTRLRGEKHESDYWIDLETTPQPFGGRRWWFICPRTLDRVANLHLPPGSLTFASRRAYTLGYRSQRETPRDRSLGRAFKLRRRLGDEGGIGDFVLKPKWMRWATFDRAMASIEAAETTVDAYTKLLFEKLDRLQH